LRKIGQLKTSEQIEELYYIMYSHDIKSYYDQEVEDEFILWVLSDDQIVEAKSIYKDYVQEPGHEKFRARIEEAKKKLTVDQHKEVQEAANSNYVDMKARFSTMSVLNQAPLTMGLIVICGLLYLLSMTGARHYLQSLLMYSLYEFPGGLKPFLEIKQGEVWRLFTPILLHGGFLHLLFNLFWLYQIGPPVEKQAGAWYYVFLIISIAVFSNTLYYLVAGPSFLGLSGVVYGLCGFIWAYGQINPFAKIYIDPQTIKFLTFWYVFCWFLTIADIMGVANTIHGAGAIVGAFMGAGLAYFDVRKQNLRLASIFKDHTYTLLILLLLLLGGMYTDYAKYPRF
jgi:GlpG protein